MPVTHWFTLVCDNLIKSTNGKVSFIDIIGDFSFESFPASLPRLVFVTGLIGRPDHVCTMELVDPEGHSVPIASQDPAARRADLSSEETEKLMLSNELLDIRFHSGGTYQVVLKHGKSVINRYKFCVTERQAGKEAKRAQRGRSRRKA